MIITRVPFQIDTRSGQFFVTHVLNPCRTAKIYTTITHEQLKVKKLPLFFRQDSTEGAFLKSSTLRLQCVFDTV